MSGTWQDVGLGRPDGVARRSFRSAADRWQVVVTYTGGGLGLTLRGRVWMGWLTGWSIRRYGLTGVEV